MRKKRGDGSSSVSSISQLKKGAIWLHQCWVEIGLNPSLIEGEIRTRQEIDCPYIGQSLKIICSSIPLVLSPHPLSLPLLPLKDSPLDWSKFKEVNPWVLGVLIFSLDWKTLSSDFLVCLLNPLLKCFKFIYYYFWIWSQEKQKLQRRKIVCQNFL